ncbi:MAG: single-stranded DNA-binding protein [Pirellulaceae bacterium]|nr:MAG: single-stranded DNA-binding protein [Pirellulaceae bacterium]
MASYNRVILMGNLTRDVQLRFTPNQTAVAEIGLAVNDRRKSQTGEWVEETTFVDVTLWGRTAEVAAEYLSKGSPVFIEGRLKLDSWEKDGQKNYKLRVVADRMQLIGGRSSSGSRQEGSGGYPGRSDDTDMGSAGIGQQDDDEVPF